MIHSYDSEQDTDVKCKNHYENSCIKVKQLEASLGVTLSPSLCPQVQSLDVPVDGAPPRPDAAARPHQNAGV